VVLAVGAIRLLAMAIGCGLPVSPMMRIERLGVFPHHVGCVALRIDGDDDRLQSCGVGAEPPECAAIFISVVGRVSGQKV